MLLSAPTAHHLDLYRYWRAKRGERLMPARGDLDPIDFAPLLPYLMLVERVGLQYRYRLIGSGLTQQLGRDVTGAVVGSQFSNASEAIAVKRAIYDRVFAAPCAVLASVELVSSFGAVHNILQLLLPLSANGTEVDMVISTLIARFNMDSQERGNLKRLAAGVRDVFEVDDASELKRLCLEWELKRKGGPQQEPACGE